MISEQSSLKIQRACIWCGPLFEALTLIGWFGFSQGYLPVPAYLDAASVKDYFVGHQLKTAIGLTIWLIACGILGAWTSQLSAMMSKSERGVPVMALCQACGGFGVVFFITLSCCLWIGAGYRADASPDIAVALNDAAWFGFVMAYPLLSLQMIAPSVVGLCDDKPWIPKWLCWWGIFGAIAGLTANGVCFVKDGIFAWHSFLGYYWPMIAWGTWMTGLSFFMLRELKRERQAGI
jgi:hypothetical protein